MKKVLLTLLAIIIFSACSSDIEPTIIPEPVVEEIVYEQIVDNGKIYSSKDFFDAGFNDYKEYNVSKLTSATEAWYGYWGPDEDIKYYELRFYPDHSTAVLEGTSFAEDDTGEDAKLDRKETMWRVGLPDRKISASCEAIASGKKGTGSSRCGERFYKYGDYIIFNNVIMLCEGEDSNEAFKLCNDLIDLLGK